MTTAVPRTGRDLPIKEIHLPDNVRALDDAHVQALAGSIELQGILVPLVVRERGDAYELVAGFHRMADARALGLADVPVTIHQADSEDADRAVENITRKQLNSYEEAKAVRAMSGAASAWPASCRRSAGPGPASPRA
jgi:ParB family chromosome partitioning protein